MNGSGSMEDCGADGSGEDYLDHDHDLLHAWNNHHDGSSGGMKRCLWVSGQMWRMKVVGGMTYLLVLDNVKDLIKLIK